MASIAIIGQAKSSETALRTHVLTSEDDPPHSTPMWPNWCRPITLVASVAGQAMCPSERASQTLSKESCVLSGDIKSRTVEKLSKYYLKWEMSVISQV